MSQSRAVHAALWAACAFAAMYLLQGALHLPALVYDPARRAFSIASTPGGLQMRYYSDLLGASVAGGLAALLRLKLPSRPFEPLVLTGAALALVGLDVAFFLSRVLAAR
jgi:hypothetical protein